MLTAELWIAHTLGVSLKIVRFDANRFQDLGIDRFDRAQSDNQLIDFAFVEQALLMDFRLGFLVYRIAGIQPASKIPKVLARVIQIDDLHGSGKMQISQIPDPLGSIAHDDFLFGVPQPRFHASR
jgi:hypothetical protein